MAWKIELTPRAQKNLKDLQPQTAKRIVAFLNERLAPLENPRVLGESLQGNLSEFWKYRVGDYRVITQIEDGLLRILVVRIGDRKDVYRK